MPSHAPRNEPIKKKEELNSKELSLVTILRTNGTESKIFKAVEKYRLANLSLLKAKSHELLEREFQGKENNLSLDEISERILMWQNKSSLEIISDLKLKYGI